MSQPRKFAVGQRVWEFDQNRRIYPKPEEGRIYASSPIYSEHFEAHRITGIDERCYLIAYDDASWPYPRRIGFAKAERTYRTDAERDDAIWENVHRRRIIDQMWKADAATLRRVAEVIGYREEPTQ